MLQMVKKVCCVSCCFYSFTAEVAYSMRFFNSFLKVVPCHRNIAFLFFGSSTFSSAPKKTLFWLKDALVVHRENSDVLI